MNIERTKTFELKFPITHKGEEIKSLTLRRAKMSDVKKITSAKEEDMFDAILQAIADLAGKPLELMDEIDPEDYKPMLDWGQEMLGKFSAN
ncbi:hypothetical protein BWR17_18190 (plasmid) [Phaeobacter inhibens]|uniref:phage tail assembly protein n=1 Tax=Phaeobacter inhibens TaxID=221822 RepID=UPI000971B9B2|nr:phage tail assembly protein [Phaeobacter inhibens]APX17821.1 hypothetical protein BWR17_18190 [Phaeobacter inhibens]